MKGKMKEKMKRDRGEKLFVFFFFSENVSGPSNRQMNQPNMFRKKIPVGRIILTFFFESSESDRVFNYLHDSNSIFRAGIINAEWVGARTERVHTLAG